MPTGQAGVLTFRQASLVGSGDSLDALRSPWSPFLIPDALARSHLLSVISPSRRARRPDSELPMGQPGERGRLPCDGRLGQDAQVLGSPDTEPGLDSPAARQSLVSRGATITRTSDGTSEMLACQADKGIV